MFNQHCSISLELHNLNCWGIFATDITALQVYKYLLITCRLILARLVVMPGKLRYQTILQVEGCMPKLSQKQVSQHHHFLIKTQLEEKI